MQKSGQSDQVMEVSDILFNCWISFWPTTNIKYRRQYFTIQMEEMSYGWFLGGEEQCCHIIIMTIWTKVIFSVIAINAALQQKIMSTT